MLPEKDRCYSEQLLYRFAVRPKNTTPERQSLVNSHRQRRWLNNELTGVDAQLIDLVFQYPPGRAKKFGGP